MTKLAYELELESAKSGDNPVEQLIDLLERTDTKVQSKIALALMELKDDRAIVPLLEKAQLKSNYTGSIVYALSHFNCQGHEKTLFDIGLKGGFEVRQMALMALEKIDKIDYALFKNLQLHVKNSIKNFGPLDVDTKDYIYDCKEIFDEIELVNVPSDVLKLIEEHNLKNQKP